jgi:hypothetical protein
MSIDSEEARLVDRIRATAFYQAKMAGATFITRKWVADQLNRSENLGEIVKDRVERLMHQESGPGRYSEETLKMNLQIVLNELEYDTDLFESLLCSMPERLTQVRMADGGHTDF